MTKILFTATVVKTHINAFHLPFIAWCKAQGWETHVAAGNDYGSDNCIVPNCDMYYDVPFARSPFSLINIKAYKQLKHIIDTNDYDIIHCNTPVAGVLTRLAARKARKRGTKLIYMAHGFHFFDGAPLLNWAIYYPIEKRLAKDTDVLVLINQEDYHRANDRRFKAGRIEYLPGVGVDLKRFSPSGKRDNMRDELGVSTDDIMLLSTGELIPRKNHITILNALAKMKNDRIRYFICGDGEMRQAISYQIQKLGLAGKVSLLGFRQDIPEICEAADIFAFPSLQEGLPVALMEAMASGLPCVASAIRGNMDLIGKEETEYLCPARDSSAFACAINRLANEPELREKLGIYNKEHIKAFDISSILTRMASIYMSCLMDKDL